MEQDFYQILGVLPTANLREIKARYEFLIFAFHPDRFEQTSPRRNRAEEETKRVNQAYQTLSNPDERAKYDQKLGAARHSHSRDSNDQLRTANSRIADLEQSLGNAIAESRRLESKIKTLLKENASLRLQLEEATQHGIPHVKIGEMERQIQDLKDEIQKRRAAYFELLENASRESQNLREERDGLAEQLAGMNLAFQTEIDSLKTRIAFLEDENRDQLTAYQSLSKRGMQERTQFQQERDDLVTELSELTSAHQLRIEELGSQNESLIEANREQSDTIVILLRRRTQTSITWGAIGAILSSLVLLLGITFWYPAISRSSELLQLMVLTSPLGNLPQDRADNLSDNGINESNSPAAASVPKLATPTPSSTATATQTPTITPTPTPTPFTYPTLAYNYDTLKGERWEQYRAELIGQYVTWTGRVTNLAWFGSDVSVDVGQSNYWSDVTLEFGENQDRSLLQVGDNITFSAKIRDIFWSVGLELRLSDVELLTIQSADDLQVDPTR